MGPPMNEDKARRWFRIWTLGFLILAVVSSIGTTVSYVRDAPLLNGQKRQMAGTVLRERKGFLGIRNIVTVAYDVGGVRHRADIPVKGDGFRGPRVGPYFYKVGAPVELLVDPHDVDRVRTKDRWVPAVNNWAVVAVIALVMLPGIALLRLLALRQYTGPE